MRRTSCRKVGRPVHPGGEQRLDAVVHRAHARCGLAVGGPSAWMCAASPSAMTSASADRMSVLPCARRRRSPPRSAGLRRRVFVLAGGVCERSRRCVTSAGTIHHRADPVVTPRRRSHLWACRQSPTLVTRMVTGKSETGVERRNPRELVDRLGRVGRVGQVGQVQRATCSTRPTCPTRSDAYVVSAASTPLHVGDRLLHAGQRIVGLDLVLEAHLPLVAESSAARGRGPGSPGRRGRLRPGCPCRSSPSGP